MQSPASAYPRTDGEKFLDLELTDVAMRLASAALTGMAIGINRDLAQKPIGMRTLGLVSLGASTVTVAAIQVQGMAENADAMSRVVQGVIQGVMAGISFIGAGVILRSASAHGGRSDHGCERVGNGCPRNSVRARHVGRRDHRCSDCADPARRRRMARGGAETERQTPRSTGRWCSRRGLNSRPGHGQQTR